MERGLTRPAFSVLSAIAGALGVSLEHFVALEEEEIGELNPRLREQLSAAGIAE